MAEQHWTPLEPALTDAGAEWPADREAEDATTPVSEPKCFRQEFSAQAGPMEILLLLDSSPFRSYHNLHARLQASLVSLVDRLQSGVALGMQVYPAGPFQDRCDPSALDVLSVAMQPAPDVAVQVNAVLSELPRTAATHADHPLRPVLVAALSYLEARTAEAKRSGAVSERAIVLATQGTVYGCGEPALPIAPLLREALNNLGIPVYFVGIDVASEGPHGGHITTDDLDDLARASGSERAYLLGADMDETSLLVDALHAQRRRRLSCQMALPQRDGFKLDTASVSVLYDAGDGEAPQRWLLRVSATECEGGKDGLFYLPDDPRTLELCPASCAISRKAASAASLRVVADCVTVIL